MSTSRTARFTLAAISATVAFVAMLACTTSNNQPPNPVSPGQGGGGNTPRFPSLTAVAPDETCGTAGNLISIFGSDLIGDDVVTSVRVNGVTADVIDRTTTGGVDILTVVTRQQTIQIPAAGLLVDVEVTNARGQDELAGAIRLLPGCTSPPTLVTLEPATAPRVGGAPLTLRGANLSCLTSIRFVGTAGGPTIDVDLSSVTSDNTVLIESPITGVATGETFDLIVTSACGTSVLTDAFTFTGTGSGGVIPNATGIFDIATGLSSGPTAGGNTVRIVGADLSTATTVTIGTIVLRRSAGDFIVTANGEIIIIAMPASPGGASLTLGLPVVVANDEGADSPLTYTYIGAGAPDCITVTPNSGSVAGGTEVTITGSNLNDVDRVTFGGVPSGQSGVIFRPDTDGQRIVVIAPAFAVPIDVDIELQVGSGTAFTTVANCNPATFTFVDDNADPPFSITGINPEEGPQTGGTTIVITGTGLGNVNSVRICNVPATILQVLDQQVRANTGGFTGNVPVTCDVTVSTSGGESATLTDGFTYQPVVPDAVPPYAAGSATTAPECGGTTFRLNGTNFSGITAVRFSGTQVQGGSANACDIQVQSNTQVSGTVPSYITPGGPFPADVNVIVESQAGGDPTPLTFRYYANPTLTSARGPLNSRQIDPGDLITVTGTNFRPENDVFVATVRVSNSGTAPGTTAGSRSGFVPFTVLDNNTLQFTFPASFTLADAYDITIATPNQDRDCTPTTCTFTLSSALLVGGANAARVLPDIGRFSGGTTVVISGQFDFPPTAVTICGVPAAIQGGATTTSVTVLTGGVPEAAAGVPCDVIVTTLVGSDTIDDAFTYVANPDPTGLEVNTVGCGTLTYPATQPIPVRPGQTLRITGTDLANITNVTIGGNAAPINGATRTDTLLEVTVPAAPATGTTFDVQTQVIFPTAGGATDAPFTDVLAQAVDYQAPPTVTTVAPNPAAATTNVTITGTELQNVNGSATLVFFGATPATVISTSPTSLTVIVPAGTPGTNVLVTVQTCQGSATTTFSYPCNLPVITSLTPSTGAAGDLVTIDGTDLVDPDGVPAFPTVTFGATTATVTSASATSVTVLVPSGTLGTSAVVRLVTCGGTATSPNNFQYTCTTPTITSISPTAGRAGTVLTISGINLDSPDGVPPVVRVGGTIVSPTTATATSITLTVPAGAGTVQVTVDTCGGTGTSPTDFTYCPSPNATNVAPTSGASGTSVVISGTNLLDISGAQPVVTFEAGGTSRTAVVIASNATTLTVQAPAGLNGLAIVSVSTCGGTDVAGTFLYCTAPTVTSILPTTGAAGTTVTINGGNLIGNNGVPATVTFGGLVATPVLSSASRLIVTAPVNPGAPLDVVVLVTTCGGSDAAATLFSYCGTPTVTGLNPTNGPAGTEVTIAGTNLVGTDGAPSTVRFGATPATVIASSPTALTVTAPAGFANGQTANVRVTTCGGQSATSPASVFTFQGTTTCVAPTVTGIAPTAARAGDQVTITGTNLIGNDTVDGIVRFGATVATIVTATPTQFVVLVPAGAGTVGVSVQTCGGTGNAPQPFTYCLLPTTTARAPISGPAGTVVTITGTNLVGGNGQNATVTFGVTPATVLDATPTQIVVSAPAGFANGTSVNVRATTCGGTSNPQTYLYTSTTACVPPTLSALAPTFGPSGGGTTVTLTGTNLVGADGLPGVVTFGATPATLVSSSPTQLVVNTPVGAGTVTVTVTTCGGSVGSPQSFTYCSIPSITSMAPTTGPAGSIVTLTGTNLVGANGAAPLVTFGSSVATVVDSAPTRVVVVAPAGIAPGTSVNVRLSTCGGTATAASLFLYTSASFCVAPAITGIVPSAGVTGTTVTISGTNLRGSDDVDPTVRFGGVAAVVLSSTAVQTTVTVPAGAGTVGVTLQTCGGTASSPQPFTYCQAPTTTTILPASGPAGTVVTIGGTNLVGANGQNATVTFGVTPATVLDATPTQIVVSAPVGFTPGTPVNVRATTCGGTSNAQTFTYTGGASCVAPTVTGIAPTFGPAAGGTTVTVTGTNLVGADGNPGVVTFGGTPAVLVSSSPSQLVVTAPAGGGTVGVDVTTCGGTAGSPQPYQYCAPPVITAPVSPAAGPAGTIVTLTGTDLVGANGTVPEVRFGNTPATIVDFAPTRVVVVAPPGIAPGTSVTVRLTTCGGTSTAPNLFLYTSAAFCVAPNISGIAPDAGPNGTIVTITGGNLRGNDDVNPTVRFGGVAATVLSSTATQTIVVAPAGTGLVLVTLTTCGGTAQSPELYSYCNTPPTVDMLRNRFGVTAPPYPATGTIPDEFQFFGSDLVGPNGELPTVRFGEGTAGLLSVRDDEVSVAIPANTDTGLPFIPGDVVTITFCTCGGCTQTDSGGNFMTFVFAP